MEDKVKLGRPTDYRPEFDAKVIELAKQKLSMYEIAVEFDVAYSTMWRWTGVVDSFCKAYARAMTIQTAHIMRDMREHSADRNYSDRLAALRLRHESNLFDAQKVKIEGISKGTLADKSQRVFEQVEKGEMIADDLVKITSAIGTAAKIEEVTVLRDKIKLFEEREGNK